MYKTHPTAMDLVEDLGVEIPGHLTEEQAERRMDACSEIIHRWLAAQDTHTYRDLLLAVEFVADDLFSDYGTGTHDYSEWMQRARDSAANWKAGSTTQHVNEKDVK